MHEENSTSNGNINPYQNGNPAKLPIHSGAVSESVAPLIDRIEKLPRDVGWMLFGVGFVGFVAPGIFGLPFMAAGGLILWPKTARRLQNVLGRKAPEKTMTIGMRQIERFLDDLERRFPKSKAGETAMNNKSAKLFN